MSLYDAIKDFLKKDRISFHIPGHKGGRGLNPDWVRDAFSLDVTEFSETDDLQNPVGVLRDAKERIAKVFGASESFLLTNGSTLGLQAAILATCKSGDILLVDRTCHKSVISALVLAGAEPRFLAPDFDKARGLYLGFSADVISAALDENPDAVGMLLTSPTYYGVCTEMREIAELLHRRGKFLLVDEAHGAHFGFHPSLPQPALLQGADLVVQSAHKTLPALGQTSLLHLKKEGLVSKESVESALRLLQSTSPSYLLMTALDEAVLRMARDGEGVIASLLEKILQLKETARKQGILDFLDTEVLKKPQDGMRLVVDVRKTGLSGYDVAACLKKEYGIYPEMADAARVVLIVTAFNTLEDLEILQQALLSLPEKKGKGNPEPMVPLPMPQMVRSVREAWQAARETIPLSEAEGRIAAEIVSVCPPGAAVLIPGQRIDQETLEYCKTIKELAMLEVLTERG